MLVVLVGVGLAAALWAVVGARSRAQVPDLGVMSHQWVSAHHASQHASSM